VDPVKQKTAGLEGNKAIDGALIGTLAVKLLPEVVPLLCNLLKKWVGSKPERKLTVTCGEVKVDISGDLTPDMSAAIVGAMTATRRSS
jgi:hypothetical protein